MTVEELRPGDVVESVSGRWGTFVGRMPHPIYHGLALVIWRMMDGSVTLDALDLRQDVGAPWEADIDLRAVRLRRALNGKGGS